MNKLHSIYIKAHGDGMRPNRRNIISVLITGIVLAQGLESSVRITGLNFQALFILHPSSQFWFLYNRNPNWQRFRNKLRNTRGANVAIASCTVSDKKEEANTSKFEHSIC